MYQNVSIRGSSVILRQLAPPSSERNRPPFFSFASIIKYTRCPRVPGATATPERPQFSVGSPFPLIWVQVTPPSFDLYSPLPGSNGWSRTSGFQITCQKVAKTTFGLPGSKQRSTAPVVLSRNKTFVQFFPPSADRKTPRSSFGP